MGDSEAQQSGPIQGVEAMQEQWWPCLVPDMVFYESVDIVPILCKSLVDNRSNPWNAHVSRLMRVDLPADHGKRCQGHVKRLNMLPVNVDYKDSPRACDA